MKNIYSNLPKKIIVARANKHITMEELQKLTGLSITTLSDIENGKKVPRVGTVKKIADALGIDFESLID